MSGIKRPTEEIWKDVPDFEEQYEISNKGRVRNKNTGRFLKPLRNEGRTYSYVYLYEDGDQNCKYIHRLMAEIFLPEEYDPDKEIHVKNGNPTDLFPNNLHIGRISKPTLVEFAHSILEITNEKEVQIKCLNIIRRYGG